MATGTVKWFSDDKGYGFIQPDGGGKDVFVHVKQVNQSGMDRLVEGQRVIFDLGERGGKKHAVNLRDVSP